MSAPSEIPAAEYLLFVRKGAPRMYWYNSNEGIYLSPKGIGWFLDGTSYTRDWSEIATVNLFVAHIPKQGRIGTCAITFTDGFVLTILSATKWGHSDDDRNAEYGRFIADFHRVIPTELRDKIQFRTGGSRFGYVGMIVTLVIATAFFVALPLGLALYFRDWQALFITAAGLAFVWPIYTIAGATKPATYHPNQVPEELYP